MFHYVHNLPHGSYRRYLMVRLLHYLRPYSWQLIMAVILTIVSAPLATTGPLLIKASIDLFLAPDPSHSLSRFDLLVAYYSHVMGLSASPQQGISFIIAIFTCATFAGVAVQYGQVVITETAAQQSLRDLRHDIFIHLQAIPIQFYD